VVFSVAPIDGEVRRGQVRPAAASSPGAKSQRKVSIVKKVFVLTLAVSAAPFAAFAMPEVGDVVGTNPTDATAALATAGCSVKEFEAEGGSIEAKCTDAEMKMWEVYIDPKSGAVTQVKDTD
jgi:Peptidase propeptide and YPEB domain